MNDRAAQFAVVTTAGAVTVLVGSFLPWLRSGAVDRSSYELLDLVDRLGFSPDGVVGWGVRLWPVLPLLLVLAVVTAWTAIVRPRIATTAVAFAIAAGFYAAAVSIAIRLAPEAGLVRFRPGTWITFAGAATLVVGALWWAVSIRSRGSDDAAAS